MWSYEDARAALRDVLRLSRAMTYKMAVADLPLGGGKGVIMLSPHTRLSSERRHQALLDFADTVGDPGRALHHRRGRRDLEPGHERDRGANQARGRPRAEPRRVGRSQPVHGAWGRVPPSGPAASACSAMTPCMAARSGSSAWVMSARGWPSAAPGPEPSSSLADVDPDKRRLADELEAQWKSPEEALEAERRDHRPVRAGRGAQRRDRCLACAAGSSPGRPTTSWLTSRSPIS